MRDYLAVYQKLIDSIGSPKESQLSAVFKFVDRNENTNQTYIYSHGILEEDYNVSAKLFDQESLDSSSIIDYSSSIFFSRVVIYGALNESSLIKFCFSVYNLS